MDSPFARPLEENALPFFSRRIGLSATGQPVGLEGGGKLSGRVGRWTIGTLAIRQDEFENVEPSDLFVGRVAANVLAESAVGLIVTDGDPLSNLDNSGRRCRLPLPEHAFAEWPHARVRGLGISRARPKGSRAKTALGASGSGRRTRPGSRAVSASRKCKRISIRHWVSSIAATSATTPASWATRIVLPARGLRSLYTGANVQHIENLDGRLQSEVSQLRVELENQTTDKLTLEISEREGGRPRALRDLRRHHHPAGRLFVRSGPSRA